MKLTDEQEAALQTVLASTRPYATLGGLAGSGKTTIIRELVERVPNVRVLAPTGKAAQVLRRKGVAADTIHSWLYPPPEEDLNGDLIWGDPAPEETPDLIVVDEASMVYRELFQDLMSLGIRVLFVGDHGQLEPVGDNPNLMANPDVRLETVMRQAAESPILSFAHTVRTGGTMTTRDVPGLRVARPFELNRDTLLSFDQVICAFNRVRQDLNRRMRGTGPLADGDKVICLRNDRRRGLFNGLIGYVSGTPVVMGEAVHFDFVSEEGRLYSRVSAWRGQFGAERTEMALDRKHQLFDFGCAVTCHKSQGSEWDSVLVVEGLCEHWSMQRWRYTAATRAAKELVYMARAAVPADQQNLFGDAA